MVDGGRAARVSLALLSTLVRKGWCIDESIGYKVGVTLGSAVAGLLFLALVAIFFYMFYWKKWFGVGQSKWILNRSSKYAQQDVAKVDLSTNHAIAQHQAVVGRDFQPPPPTRDFYQGYEDDRRARQQHGQRSDFFNNSLSSHASSEMAKAFQQRDRLQQSQATAASSIPAGYRGSAV